MHLVVLLIAIAYVEVITAGPRRVARTS